MGMFTELISSIVTSLSASKLSKPRLSNSSIAILLTLFVKQYWIITSWSLRSDNVAIPSALCSLLLTSDCGILSSYLRKSLTLLAVISLSFRIRYMEHKAAERLLRMLHRNSKNVHHKWLYNPGNGTYGRPDVCLSSACKQKVYLPRF